MSRLTTELDTSFKQRRVRPLPQIAHRVVDTTGIKVRIDGSVRVCAALTPIGERREYGKSIVLGASAALSEAKPY